MRGGPLELQRCGYAGHERCLGFGLMVSGCKGLEFTAL